MLESLSEKIFSNRKLVILVALINLAGFFVGIYYYWSQLMDFSPLFWIVIIDSPLSVLLFAVVCLLIYFKKNVPDLLKLLTSVYVIKYGMWTMIVIGLYWSYYSYDAVLGVLNFILHFGMVLEGIVLIPRIRATKYKSAIVLAFFLLNDYCDYLLGTVTRIPPEHIGFLMTESFLASILIVGFIHFHKKIQTICHNRQS